jgi:subtilisin family serine protease
LELTSGQVAEVAADPRITIAFAELDPTVPVAAPDDPLGDIDALGFRAGGGGPTGAGVRVAVLDTGIDLRHPALTVAHSVQTAGESVDVPGRHGTHCAGIIASSDPALPGVAPGVALINVKVLRANGDGRHTGIVAGIDRALDLSADILSISLGFNHLPVEVPGGHGWTCPDGRCPLCTAVDNAVLEGALVVAAAGNEHRRSALARARGSSGDTEISCPGQARGSITVGAVHPTTGAPHALSSRGPTAFGLAKPELAAPGVDVRSTVPAPREVAGSAPGPFGAMSGTSMAASVVAGACALLIEDARRAGIADDAAAIRRRLLADCVDAVDWPAEAVGAGRLRLRRPSAG